MKRMQRVGLAVLLAASVWSLQVARAQQAGKELGGDTRERASKMTNEKVIMLIEAKIQPQSRAAYARLVKQGWTDALRMLHPDVRIYTFWHYTRNRFARDAGLRLDHLLLSPVAARRLQAAGVDRAVRGHEGASDHAPTWVTLK